MGKEVRDARDIAKNYIKGSFFIDFVAGLPFDLFESAEKEEEGGFTFKF